MDISEEITFTPRYEVATVVDQYGTMFGIRDNTTGEVMADHTGYILFSFEHNAALMTRVMNDRA
jgi:hypothetical protein